MKIIKQKKWYHLDDCIKNPTTLYIFGDNTIKEGCGGQAQIRYADNSFGIPTKKLPTMEENAFFEDDYQPLDAVNKAIIELVALLATRKYDTVVFPYDGLGTGLAQFDTRCPKAFNHMNKTINKLFKRKIYEEN